MKYKAWYCKYSAKIEQTRQKLSMIHSARPTVPPVVIIFSCDICFIFAIFWKVGTDVQMETCAKIMITTGRDCGSAEWINSVELKWIFCYKLQIWDPLSYHKLSVLILGNIFVLPTEMLSFMASKFAKISCY